MIGHTQMHTTLELVRKSVHLHRKRHRDNDEIHLEQPLILNSFEIDAYLAGDAARAVGPLESVEGLFERRRRRAGVGHHRSAGVAPQGVLQEPSQLRVPEVHVSTLFGERVDAVGQCEKGPGEEEEDEEGLSEMENRSDSAERNASVPKGVRLSISTCLSLHVPV